MSCTDEGEATWTEAFLNDILVVIFGFGRNRLAGK
jgi:hypothetical protein